MDHQPHCCFGALFKMYSANHRLNSVLLAVVMPAFIFLSMIGLIAMSKNAWAAGNTPPTISDVPNQVTDEDIPIGSITFTISDTETAPDALIVTVDSTNTGLVPVSNLFVAGTGITRTLTITPISDQNGSAIITLIVSDGSDTSQDTFVLTVNPINDAPTISGISDQTTISNTSTGPIPFTVNDVDTAPSALSLSATAADTTLIPPGAYRFSGSGTSRSVEITPAVGLTGTTNITVTVTDGSLSADSVFTLTVIAPNIPPDVTGITDQTTAEDTPLSFDFQVTDDTTPAADLAVAVHSSDPTLVPSSNIVPGGSGITRTLTITPDVNQWGETVITVDVSDGELTTSVPFTLTVTSVDDPPTMSDIWGQSTLEDVPINVTFTVSDVDTSLELLSISGSSTNESLVPNANLLFTGTGVTRTLTITPSANQFGQAPILVRVADSTNLATDSFLLVVNSVNDPPTISPIADQTVLEDVSLTDVSFTVDDVESDASNLTVIATSNNQGLIPNSNLIIGGSGANRTISAIPSANASGVAEISLTVNDGSSATIESFNITVQEVNDAPSITGTTDVTTPEDTPVTVPFTVDDVESAATNLSMFAESSDRNLVPSSNIVFGGNGTSRTATITPVPDLYGLTVLTFTVSDGALTASQSFSLTVSSVNDPPVISNIPDQRTAENAPLSIGFTVSDVDNTVSQLTVTGSSSNQALVPDSNLVLSNNDSQFVLNVAPAANTYGSTQITLSADDGSASVSQAFTLTVNAWPTISNILTQTLDEDSPLVVNFTVDDADSDVASLSLTVATSNPDLIPASGVAFSGSGSNRNLTLTPEPDMYGSATVTVTVSDGELSASDSFVAVVNPVNDPPSLGSVIDRTINQDSSISFSVTLSDVDNDPGDITLTGQSSNSALVASNDIAFEGVGSSRIVTVTPQAGQSGTATITLLGNDGQDTNSAQFVLTVNARPVIGAVSRLEMAEDATESTSISVVDVDTDISTVALSVASANPNLIPDSGLALTGSGNNRTLSITPSANASGEGVIFVTADDGLAQTTHTISVTVKPINDGPTISAFVDQVTDEDVARGPIPFVVGDIDNDVQQLMLSGSSSNTALVPHTNIDIRGVGIDRTVVITPSADLVGTAIITITVDDGALNASQSFSLTVLPVNDAPVIAPIPEQTVLEDSVITITLSLDDIDSPVEEITLSGSSSNKGLVADTNISFGGSGAVRTVTITPQPNQFGSTVITLLASDGSLTGAMNFDLTVEPVDDMPIVFPIPNQLIAEDITHTLTITLNDIDTEASNLVLFGASSNPTLIPDGNIGFTGAGITRTLTITPAANQTGSSIITVRASDAELSGETAFLVEVQPVNDPPTAIDDTVSVVEITDFSIGVLANDHDVDGDPLTVTSVGQGRVGRVTVNQDNTIRYTAPLGFTGTDSFVYTIADTTGSTDSATVFVTIKAPPGPDAPHVDSISPSTGDNSRSVKVNITGRSFAPTPDIYLGPYRLFDVQFRDSTKVEAWVPAFLPPKVYDLTIINPDGVTTVLPAVYTVTASKVTISEVRPARGTQDLPGYLHIYGANFVDGTVASLGDTALSTTVIGQNHLLAFVPSNVFAPGRYPVGVQDPSGESDTLVDGYTVYVDGTDDLSGDSFEFWSEPATLHVGQSALIGVVVRRHGGDHILTQVPVRFYLGAPSSQGTLLGNTYVPSLVPDYRETTVGLTWTPFAPGTYTLYAVIDPDNVIAEEDENNNVIARNVTVMPLSTDVLPPRIDELKVNRGASTTTDRNVTLTVRASDEGLGVQAVKFVEYEFMHSANSWIPVQESNWLEYEGVPTTFDWRLMTTPGVKYILAWVADKAGNVAATPSIVGINYVPETSDSIIRGEVRVYRYFLRAGEALTVFTIPSQGDPDLYVWPPDHETRDPMISNLAVGVDELNFVAPVTGEYQIEVYGHSDTVFRLAIEINRIGAASTSEIRTANLDANKPVRLLPFVAVADKPVIQFSLPLPPALKAASASASAHSVFLPIIVR